MTDLKRHIVDVPDFPRPGILFRDITPLLRTHFDATLDAIEAPVQRAGVAADRCAGGHRVARLHSGGGLAARRDKGFVPIRKQGKLPPPVVVGGLRARIRQRVLEMQRGRRPAALIDDVLATGGTMQAAAELCDAGGLSRCCGLAALIDLRLAGDFIWHEQPLRCVIRYD